MGNPALIYRFSKAQDCIGNNLEKINLLSVDTWFELREIRNEIAHDYEDSKAAGMNIINGIISYKDELKRIVLLFQQIEQKKDAE